VRLNVPVRFTSSARFQRSSECGLFFASIICEMSFSIPFGSEYVQTTYLCGDCNTGTVNDTSDGCSGLFRPRYSSLYSTFDVAQYSDVALEKPDMGRR
jgi:hypothetical protein